MHEFIFKKKGFSELIGMSIGLYLILYTRRKWIWVGLLNIMAGLCTYTVWLIPPTSINVFIITWSSRRTENKFCFAVKYTHQTGLAMIACIALKITVTSGISVLSACTADLISIEKKKILMLSAGIWSRAWILGGPFLLTLNTYGSLVPVTVMALLTVIGGLLFIVIGYAQRNAQKRQMKNANVGLILNKGKFNLNNLFVFCIYIVLVI